MKLILTMILVFCFPDLVAQGLEAILTEVRTSGEKIPNGVYVKDLCDECSSFGLSEFSLPGNSLIDRSASRDFRIILLEKNAKQLNPVTDKVEDCAISYLLFIDKDRFEEELKKLESSHIRIGNDFTTKSPVLYGSNKVDLKISVIKWPFRNQMSVRYGFLIIASLAK